MSEIYIKWSDGARVKIDLNGNPVAKFYQNCIRHLRHVDLRFGARENHWHSDLESFESIKNQLVNSQLSRHVEIQQDLLTQQDYLNFLHDIYVQHYQKDSDNRDWLRVHDLIHLLEDKNANQHSHTDVWFDYGEKSGPLIRPFDRSLLDFAVIDTHPGMCYIRANEIGKTPYEYYCDREPPDLERLCSLAKPWIWLKPVMDIAVIDVVPPRDTQGFEAWFEPFRERWADHWNQSGWRSWEVFAKIPIGTVDDIDLLTNRFKALDYPIRITS